MLALEAHFDVKCPNVPTFGNRPSFQCKFYRFMFKDKNTLFYHKMMNLCPKYRRKKLLKMYPTVVKFEAKELIRLGQKYGKTLPNQLKCPIEDATKHSPKRAAPLENQKQLMEMLLERPLPFKEKDS
jgi:hypothetical protein